MLHHVTYSYAHAKFEVAISNSLGDAYTKTNYLSFDLDLGVKATQNVAHYLLHHVTYAAIKFEVATSNSF